MELLFLICNLFWIISLYWSSSFCPCPRLILFNKIMLFRSKPSNSCTPCSESNSKSLTAATESNSKSLIPATRLYTTCSHVASLAYSLPSATAFPLLHSIKAGQLCLFCSLLYRRHIIQCLVHNRHSKYFSTN